MGYTDDLLHEVRNQIDAHPGPLAAARTRLDLILSIAGRFPGAARTYRSGSLPQNTFIHPVGDGDGGLVLDRRNYPALGPDGAGKTPKAITEELCALVGPAVRETYPKARCGTSKRGPKITFGQPIEDQDPTVDLVVALTRREGSGLWIPNLATNTWEASDPEQHVTLFTSGGQSLRRTRRRVIRLLKAWNKQYNQPGFSSHNLSVWAWEFVEPGMGMAAALHATLANAANRVESGRATPDPAGVSPNVKLLTTRTTAAKRLRTASDGLDNAIGHDTDRDAVQTALSRVFYNYIENRAPHGVQYQGRRAPPQLPDEDGVHWARRTVGDGAPDPRLRLCRERRVRRPPAWQVPAWYARPAPRILFQRRLAGHGLPVRVVRPPRRYRGGFAVTVGLHVPDLVSQTITIAFGVYEPAVPHVYTDGPSESPHRYSNCALCMWYPGDPAERRWTLRDGPTALLGQIVVHLLREEWWRRTGEWPGDEAAHEPAFGTSERLDTEAA